MSKYIWTFVALLLLTALTFGLSFLSLGPWGVPVALLIGLAKTVLVALFFMHLIEHRTTSRIAFMVALLLAVTLISLTALDVSSRVEIEAAEIQ